MDRLRYKRQQTQSLCHTTEKNFGNTAPVPKIAYARPQIAPRIINEQPTIGPPQLRQTAPASQPGHAKITNETLSRIRVPVSASTAPELPASAPLVELPTAPTQTQEIALAADGFEKTPFDIEFERQAAQQFSNVAHEDDMHNGPMHAVMPQLASVEAVESEPAAMAVSEQVPDAPVPAYSLPPIDMELPGEDSPSLFNRMKSRKTRRWAFRGMATVLIVAVTTGGLLASQGYGKANKVFNGSTGTAAALKKDVAPELLDGEGAGRINVLLLGRGGNNHDAPDLTDTIILASIDPINHTSTLFSIPRDLWVTVPNHGVMKLNAAWETGVFKYQGNGHTGSVDPSAIKAGFNLVDQTIGDAIGIKINYNVILNFDAFKQAIDTVNGVDINVPTDLVDGTMSWENANDPTLAHAGQQNMNGKKALLYVRSRETSSDFARGQRQRAVMLALKDKITSLGTLSNPLKLSGLLNAFGNNVQTDLSLNNANRLYSLTKDINDTNTASLDLASPTNMLVTTGNVNGQSVVLPKAGLFKYDAIQEYIRGQLKDPYIVRENARIMVLNGSTTPGLATAKANELKGYGYNVVGMANTPTSGWAKSTLVDLSKGADKYTRHYLESHYNLQAVNHMPDDTIATNNADFVIIIGSNEATSPQIKAR